MQLMIEPTINSELLAKMDLVKLGEYFCSHYQKVMEKKEELSQTEFQEYIKYMFLMEPRMTQTMLIKKFSKEL